jgi:hypothetical protein
VCVCLQVCACVRVHKLISGNLASGLSPCLSESDCVSVHVCKHICMHMHAH